MTPGLHLCHLRKFRQVTAGTNVNLEGYEVETGAHLRDGVFDLQTSVDFEEEELLGACVVNVLDGTGAVVRKEFANIHGGLMKALT